MKLSIISALVSLSLLASTASADVHTWHHVTATEGHWKTQLVIASADEKGYFTDQAGSKKGQMYAFDVQSGHAPALFGFGFEFPGTDFDVAYTVTMVKQQQSAAHRVLFSSPACQFNVSAKGPANPDVRVESYNGAQCHYTIISSGEDYTVG